MFVYELNGWLTLFFILFFMAQPYCYVNGTSRTSIGRDSNHKTQLAFLSPTRLRHSSSRCRKRRCPALVRNEQDNDSSVTSNDQKENTSLRSFDDRNYWLNLGSAITTESCRLLGTKSLGVDYGLVRTGLAVTVGFEPTPLTILSDTSNNVSELCRTIVQYATAQQVQQIIVGLPLHKNGTVAEQTLLTLNFTQQLATAVLSCLGPDVPILLFDERYTSKEAAAREHTKNPSSALYGTLDATAACIILENYYEDNGIGAHTVALPVDVKEYCLRQYIQRQKDLEQQRLSRMEANQSKVRRRIDAIEQAKVQAEDMKRCLEVRTDSSSSKPRKKKKRK
jgi:putative holliday junction resolvase